PGRGAARGPRAGRRGPPLPGRGDPRTRARARPRRVAGPPARRPRPGLGCGVATIALEMGDLSHVDESGAVRMVDVGSKPLSRRRAVAAASVRMAPGTAARLCALPKGDALVTAQLAGVMAAKRTAELIPLCHPLPLSSIDVSVGVRGATVEIEATVETTAQTGVEMEALVAASVAALTVYDMAKAIDKEMVVDGVRLLEKTKEPIP